jgi:hypothetical protein
VGPELQFRPDRSDAGDAQHVYEEFARELRA